MHPMISHEASGTVSDRRVVPPPEPPSNSYEAFVWSRNPDPQEWTPSEFAEYWAFAQVYVPGAPS